MYYKSCSEIRRCARENLSGKYWYSTGVCLLFTLITGIVSAVAELASKATGTTDDMGLNLTGFIIFIAGSFLIIFPLTVGLIRFFIKSAKDVPDLNNLMYPFKNGFMNVVKASVKKSVFIFLWTLLFIIPGLVKTYSYFMVDYLLAENPSLDSSRAFDISKAAMQGFKAKAFLLELSFIGYFYLGILTFGVGLILLEPYMRAALSVFYEEVKENAIMHGIVSNEEISQTSEVVL